MRAQSFPISIKSSWKPILVACLVAVYTAVNVFRMGRDTFVVNLNNNISNLLALGVTVLAFVLVRRLAVKGKNRLLWWGLTIGWALWTVAELWWGIAALLNAEVPYPSWADFFWLVGYIPMYLALRERIRSLPQKVGPLQRAALWLSILLCIGGTVWFVLAPVVRNGDPSALVESVLDIFYPLADLVLLLLVLRIFFTYQPGMYGRVWAWISTGFILVSLSDLIFSYATTVGQYYPEGQVNLLSTLGVDVPYNLSYLCWIIGLVILLDLQRIHHTFTDADIPLTTVPDTHLLVFAQGDDTVIDVSRNYSHVFSLEAVQGKTISQALGCSPDAVEGILREIKTKNILKERAIQVDTRFGPRQALVSGISAVSSLGESTGVILLLRMLIGDDSLDERLTVEQKGVVRLVLSQTGMEEEEEIKRLLTDYYLAFLKAFYNRIISEEGGIMADAFLSELQSVARQHEWRIRIRLDALLDVSALSPSIAPEALPVLFETAKQFVTRITDEATANAIVQNVRSHIDESALRNVAHFAKTSEEHT